MTVIKIAKEQEVDGRSYEIVFFEKIALGIMFGTVQGSQVNFTLRIAGYEIGIYFAKWDK